MSGIFFFITYSQNIGGEQVLKSEVKENGCALLYVNKGEIKLQFWSKRHVRDKHTTRKTGCDFTNGKCFVFLL